MMARLGGILAPVISSLAEDNFMYIFGALGVGSSLVCFLLSETQGAVMTDTAEQKRRREDLVFPVKFRSRLLTADET